MELADQPGWLGGTYGFTDDGQFVGVVRFESQAACEEISSMPGADLWWAGAEELFDSGCEIHESDDVSMMLDGGSDDAGFVQIMRGRIFDEDRLRHFMTDTEMTAMLHQARPDLVGATLAIEADGTFTETIAFTDEASARAGEQREMPADMRDDLASAMTEVEYIDLHRPWFASRR